MIRTDEVQLRVLIDGSPARKELATLDQAAIVLRENQKKLEANAKEAKKALDAVIGSVKDKNAVTREEKKQIDAANAAIAKANAELEANSKLLRENEARQAALRKEIGVSALQVPELQKRLRELNLQLRHMNDGPERVLLEKELLQVKQRLNELTTAAGQNARIWAEERKELRLTDLTIHQLEQEARHLRDAMAHLAPNDPRLAQFRRELERVENQTARLRDGLGPLGRMWADIKGQVVGTVASITAVLGGGAIISGIQNWVRGSADLSDAQAEVQRTTGMTRAEVRELTKQLGQFNTRTARSELLDLSKEAGKLGITGVKDVAAFVRAGDALNVALGEELGEGAITAIGKLNQTFKVGEATGKDLEHQMLSTGSAITVLGNNSTASGAFIVDYTTRLAGVNTQARINIESTMGYAAALDQLGQRSETSSTAVSRFTVDAFKDVATYAKIARMSVADFQKLLDTDANEALLRTLEGLNGNNAGLQVMTQKFADMGEEGARAVGVLASLANNTKLIREQQRLATQSFADGTAVMDAFNTKNSTLGANLDRLKKTLHGLFTSSTITDAINSIVQSLRGMLDWLIKSKDTIVVYAKVLGNVVLTLVAYRVGILAAAAATRIAAAAQTAYAFAMTVLSGEVTIATAAMSLFNGVMKLNPVGLVVSALTAAIGLFVTFGDEIRGISEATRKLLDERIGLNALFEQIKSVNTSTDDRRKLIAQLNELYGKYLPYQVSEFANLQNIEQAQIAANDALVKGIEIEAKQTVLQEKRNAALEAEVAVLKAKEDLKEAQAFAGTFQGQLAGKDEVTAGEKRIQGATRALNNKITEAKELAKAYEDAFNALGGAGLNPPPTEPKRPVEPPAPTGETAEQKAAREAAEKAARDERTAAEKKAEDDLKKHMEALEQIASKARQELLLATSTADEKELEQLREKHRAELKEAREHVAALVKAKKLTPQEGEQRLSGITADQLKAEAALIKSQEDKKLQIARDADAKYTAERLQALDKINDATDKAHIQELRDEVQHWDDLIATAKEKGGYYGDLEEKRHKSAAKLADALAFDELQSTMAGFEDLIVLGKKHNIDVTGLEKALARAKTAIQERQRKEEKTATAKHYEEMRLAIAAQLRNVAVIGGGLGDAFQGIAQMRHAEEAAEEARADADGKRTEEEIARIEARKRASREAAMIAIQVQMATAIANGVASAMAAPNWVQGVAQALSTVGIVLGLMAQAQSLLNASSGTSVNQGNGGNVEGTVVGEKGIRKLDGPSHSDDGLGVYDERTGQRKYELEGGEAVINKEVTAANAPLIDAMMDAAHRPNKKLDGDVLAAVMSPSEANAPMRVSYLSATPRPINTAAVRTALQVEKFAMGGHITHGTALVNVAAPTGGAGMEIPVKKQKNPGLAAPDGSSGGTDPSMAENNALLRALIAATNANTAAVKNTWRFSQDYDRAKNRWDLLNDRNTAKRHRA